MTPSHVKKSIAEAIGTFLLSAAVITTLTLTHSPVVTPVAAGLTLGLMVFVIGGISGAHLNPAITVALWSVKKISMKEGGVYIVAQIIGALLARMAMPALLGAVPTLTVGTSFSILVAEALGAAVLACGVGAVVHSKAPESASGLVIGGSLLLGIILASSVSNGVLNPAVAMSIGSLNLMYLIGPFVGALVGMQLFKWIASAK